MSNNLDFFARCMKAVVYYYIINISVKGKCILRSSACKMNIIKADIAKIKLRNIRLDV